MRDFLIGTGASLGLVLALIASGALIVAAEAVMQPLSVVFHLVGAQ